MTTVGFIGVGNLGSAVARALVGRGYDVVLSNSRGPETLTDLVAELGERARAATPDEAAAAGEFVVVAVPLRAYRDLPTESLAGKIVLDANNYYWERDGHIVELDEKRATTSGLVQAHLAASKVAKAFSHIIAAQILSDGTPAGTTNRRALGTASDHTEAADLVTALYDELGFDTVNLGPLSESWRLQRDQPTYTVVQTRDELAANAARASR